MLGQLQLSWMSPLAGQHRWQMKATTALVFKVGFSRELKIGFAGGWA
jgi:hypothetical protein